MTHPIRIIYMLPKEIKKSNKIIKGSHRDGYIDKEKERKNS